MRCRRCWLKLGATQRGPRRHPMHHSALRVIRDEHASLAAMLQSMLQMIKRGPDADGKHAPEQYFDVLRAMLFYIDEFPEKLHHPKESDLLFPRIARVASASKAARRVSPRYSQAISRCMSSRTRTSPVMWSLSSRSMVAITCGATRAMRGNS
eukprot:gene19352-38656_t